MLFPLRFFQKNHSVGMKAFPTFRLLKTPVNSVPESLVLECSPEMKANLFDFVFSYTQYDTARVDTLTERRIL